MLSRSLSALFITISVPILASPGLVAAQESEVLLQRQAQEREAWIRQQQEVAPDVQLLSPLPSQTGGIPVGEQPCFVIRRMVLTGPDAQRFDGLIDAAMDHDGPDHPLGQCLGIRGVEWLVRRMQDALVERGYLTSRVLVAPQDLASGELQLTVLAGRIRAIRFVDPVPVRATRWNAVPARAGDVLNLRDLEQALENFKRVPSVEADIRIAPGPEPGQSDVLLDWRQGQPLRLSVFADDSGTRGTGRYQGGVSIAYDHWWTLNDLFYISLNSDLGGGDTGERGTRGGTVHYSVPWGYWALGFTASRYRYFQTVAGQSQDYRYSGQGHQQEVHLSRLVHRDAKGKTTLGLKAFARQSGNHIDDTEIEVQRRRVGGWVLDLGHRAFLGAGVLDLGLAYKRGTGAFGSLPAPEKAFGEGTARFALLNAHINWQQPLAWGRQKWRYSTQWRAQLNRTPLTPQDRFAIGGRHTVRGFDGARQLSGDRGWLLRNELDWACTQTGQMYWGFDLGRVSGPGTALLPGRALAGIAFGLRGRVGSVSYDVFIAKPVEQPDSFGGRRSVSGFSLQWSI